ncbi:unnamed protein product [Effrenium voratum]|nr:unnamed protein product [Effrenium voratum]
MSILVTGSAGHLGEALCRHYQEHFPEIPVVGVDRLASPFTTLVLDLSEPSAKEVLAEVFTQRRIGKIFHAATLHKPHVATHTEQAFIAVNIQATQMLLDLAVQHGDGALPGFVFTSTTSTFGHAVPRGALEGCAWIEETVAPIPRNIYGITKIAAEHLCQLAQRNHKLPVAVVRTSRFFLEGDDDDDARASMGDCNLKVNELLYRRGDVADMVSAHLLAMDWAMSSQKKRKMAAAVDSCIFIASAPSPFRPEDVEVLAKSGSDACQHRILERMGEACGCSGAKVAEMYKDLGWQLPHAFDRIYDSRKAQQVLGWAPRYTFASQLSKAHEVWRKKKEVQVATGTDVISLEYCDLCSPLHVQVGKKSYHEGQAVASAKAKPYPTAER